MALVPPNNPYGSILFNHQLINDALIIQQDQPSSHDNCLAFMHSFGNPGTHLEWESSGDIHSNIFLDFTLKFNEHHGVDTQICQKPMNLYLYSGHPHLPPSPQVSYMDSFLEHYTTTTTTGRTIISATLIILPLSSSIVSRLANTLYFQSLPSVHKSSQKS